MTDLIDRIEALYQKATGGKWIAEDHAGWAHPYVSVRVGEIDVIRLHDKFPPHVEGSAGEKSIGATFLTVGKVEREIANAKLIAEIVNAWPEIRDRLKEIK